MSSRSLKVCPQYIEQVKSALRRKGFARHIDLAENLQLSRSTIGNFLNGKPVDYLNFYEISEKLAQDWQKIADWDSQGSHNLYADDVKDEDATTESSQDTSEAEVSHYVERPPIESSCYETTLRPGSLLRIKAPKRMGKTLLIDKILHQAAQQKYRTVRLSLLLADGAVLTSLDKFLRWFCVVVCKQLRLPTQLDDFWEEGLGSNYNCTMYFEDYLLPKINSPLVLALDEVDRIFSYPEIAEDFFAMLRAWHEEARSRAIWKKLRLVVAHSTEVYIPLNINRSPFNVGVPIELPELTPEQVQDLAKRQGLNWDTSQVMELMSLVGGHPYLVQRAIYYLTRSEITFEQLLQTAYTEAGIYSDHLRGHLWNLQQHSELATAMKKVVSATSPVQLETMEAFKLQSLGLVQLYGNEVKPRCDLYARYFCDRL